MILPFSTKFKDGKETNFIEKIWLGLIAHQLNPVSYNSYRNTLVESGKTLLMPSNNDLIKPGFKPKYHSIREDKNNRWRPGVKIHMVVFNRTKNRFQFAPVLECKSVQDINIVYADQRVNVFIDCKYYDGNFDETGLWL